MPITLQHRTTYTQTLDKGVAYYRCDGNEIIVQIQQRTTKKDACASTAFHNTIRKMCGRAHRKRYSRAFLCYDSQFLWNISLHFYGLVRSMIKKAVRTPVLKYNVWCVLFRFFFGCWCRVIVHITHTLFEHNRFLLNVPVCRDTKWRELAATTTMSTSMFCCCITR